VKGEKKKKKENKKKKRRRGEKVTQGCPLSYNQSPFFRIESKRKKKHTALLRKSMLSR
jgi:hypothetical protein